MKILIDECLPIGIKVAVSTLGHECESVREVTKHPVSTEHDWAQDLRLDSDEQIQPFARLTAPSPGISGEPSISRARNRE